MTLLQFCGPQDIEALGRVCEAINDMDMNWSGGSTTYIEALEDAITRINTQYYPDGYELMLLRY